MLKIIDLYADWCMPCRAQKPILEEIESLYANEVTISRINVDGDEEITTYYNVRSIPTMIFEKDGTILEKIVGLQSKEAIEAKIEQYK
jgi:thioredoxin 1